MRISALVLGLLLAANAPLAFAQEKPAAGKKPEAKSDAKPAKPAAKPAAAKPAAASVSSGAQPTLLGQYGDWGAYSAMPGGQKVCFALAKPANSETVPNNRRNANMGIHLFISSRPVEKVKDEVSLLISGYAFKQTADASATIGSINFALYTKEDGAWIKNAAEEARMVEVMRKNAELVVKGTTDKGTQTIDTFSLRGIDQALNRVAQECK